MVDAMDMYSTFELDQATVGCFLEQHEMQFAPKKTQKPLVVLIVLRGILSSKYLKMHIKREDFEILTISHSLVSL